MIELETNFKIISFKHGEIQFDLASDTSTGFISSLTNFLNGYTNIKWDLIRLNNKDAKTISSFKKEEEIKLKKMIDENDIVQEIKKIFPGSKIAKSSLN